MAYSRYRRRTRYRRRALRKRRFRRRVGRVRRRKTYRRRKARYGPSTFKLTRSLASKLPDVFRTRITVKRRYGLLIGSIFHSVFQGNSVYDPYLDGTKPDDFIWFIDRYQQWSVTCSRMTATITYKDNQQIQGSMIHLIPWDDSTGPSGNGMGLARERNARTAKLDYPGSKAYARVTNFMSTYRMFPMMGHWPNNEIVGSGSADPAWHWYWHVYVILNCYADGTSVADYWMDTTLTMWVTFGRPNHDYYV